MREWLLPCDRAWERSQGLQATHAVLNVTTTGGDFVYAPTALPPGGACTEMTTAYTPSGPKLWAWDWCGGRDTIGKIVNMDAAFQSTYTRCGQRPPRVHDGSTRP